MRPVPEDWAAAVAVVVVADRDGLEYGAASLDRPVDRAGQKIS